MPWQNLGTFSMPPTFHNLPRRLRVPQSSQGFISRCVLQRLQGIWVGSPDNVKYSPAVWNGALDPDDIFFLIRFYIDYLYSIFLIFRFNVRHDQSQETLELLLSAARDVLLTVLIFNEHRELMREVRSDFSAVVSVFLRLFYCSV